MTYHSHDLTKPVVDRTILPVTSVGENRLKRVRERLSSLLCDKGVAGAVASRLTVSAGADRRRADTGFERFRL